MFHGRIREESNHMKTPIWLKEFWIPIINSFSIPFSSATGLMTGPMTRCYPSTVLLNSSNSGICDIECFGV